MLLTWLVEIHFKTIFNSQYFMLLFLYYDSKHHAKNNQIDKFQSVSLQVQ